MRYLYLVPLNLGLIGGGKDKDKNNRYKKIVITGTVIIASILAAIYLKDIPKK